MHHAKETLPVKIDAPGAVARQLPGFGDASAYGNQTSPRALRGLWW